MGVISVGILWQYWPIILISVLTIRGLYRRYLHPLRGIPGPFLASTTNLWRLAVFLRGRQHLEYHALFQKYGPIVRLGPNSVIFNDAAHIPEYFGWDKSDWVKAFSARTDVYSHGNIIDIKEHAKAKSEVMIGYSMSNVLKGEDKVDGHVSDLMDQFAKRCNTIFDIAPWTQWVAFDIVMDAAFSRTLGFVKSASDVNNFIAGLHVLLPGAATIALFPSVVAFIQHPWIFPYLAPKPTDKSGPGALFGLAWGQVKLRLEEQNTQKYDDMLQFFIDHKDREGTQLSNVRLQLECEAPILAGSDTAATVLRAIILFLATNARVLGNLRAEIDAADAAGLLSTPPKFQELKQHVPYIAAVMKEAMRVYPVLGSPAVRKIPPDGAVICGHYLAPGTEIGLCQYAVGRNKSIFGEDADRFRPERWTEEVDPTTKKLRDTGDVFFGNGAMMCSGRNLATLEVWKIATQFFRQFDVEVIDPLKPWKETDSLVMLISDFRVRLDLRKKHVNTA